MLPVFSDLHLWLLDQWLISWERGWKHWKKKLYFRLEWTSHSTPRPKEKLWVFLSYWVISFQERLCKGHSDSHKNLKYEKYCSSFMETSLLEFWILWSCIIPLETQSMPTKCHPFNVYCLILSSVVAHELYWEVCGTYTLHVSVSCRKSKDTASKKWN